MKCFQDITYVKALHAIKTAVDLKNNINFHDSLSICLDTQIFMAVMLALCKRQVCK